MSVWAALVSIYVVSNVCFRLPPAAISASDLARKTPSRSVPLAVALLARPQHRLASTSRLQKGLYGLLQGVNRIYNIELSKIALPVAIA